jgi:hypothetical protein
MLPLDILFHALELIATFAVGAWTGHTRCRVAFAVSTEELRRDSWLDRLCCRPRRALSWRRSASEPQEVKGSGPILGPLL